MTLVEWLKFYALTIAGGMPPCMACRYLRFFAAGVLCGVAAMGLAVWGLWRWL